jgi:hypothetical protein
VHTYRVGKLGILVHNKAAKITGQNTKNFKYAVKKLGVNTKPYMLPKKQLDMEEQIMLNLIQGQEILFRNQGK